MCGSGSKLFLLHERFQVSHRFFHYPCAFYHLGKKHFARAKQITDRIHSIHQWAFDDMERPFIVCPALLDILVDVIDYSVDQGMFQAFLNGCISPRFFGGFCFPLLFHGLCEIHQPFSCIYPAVKEDIFDLFKKFFWNILVDLQLARIDNCHVQSCLDGMVKERAVHGFPDRFIFLAPESKRNIAHTATGFGQREKFFKSPHRFKEFNSVI